jgi:hemoglobin-like flavoprotein
MNPDSERLVRETWSRLKPAADRMATTFYARLFDIDPDVRERFSGVDMGTQRQKFMEMMDGIVRVLDEPGQLVSELAASGRRHVQYGATRRGYESIGAALLWSIERELGADFTPSVRDAWRELYGVVSAVMRRASVRMISANG